MSFDVISFFLSFFFRDIIYSHVSIFGGIMHTKPPLKKFCWCFFLTFEPSLGSLRNWWLTGAFTSANPIGDAVWGG